MRLQLQIWCPTAEIVMGMRKELLARGYSVRISGGHCVVVTVMATGEFFERLHTAYDIAKGYLRNQGIIWGNKPGEKL